MINIRPAKPTDLNYVVSGWIRSLRSQYPYKFYSKPAMQKLSARVQEIVYKKSECTVLCDQAAEDVVLAWAVHDPGVLHYIWVKYPFRRNGFGTKLFRHIFGAISPLYSTYTNSISHARLDKRWGLEHYDPFMIEDLLFGDSFKFDMEAIK